MARVSSVMAKLKTIWEALTPPTEASLVYNELSSQVIATSGAVHRQFWFQVGNDATIALIQDYGAGSSIFETRFDAVLRLSVIGKAQDVVVSQATDEAMLLARAANLHDWSDVAGVDEVEIADIGIRPGPYGTIDLNMRVRARTQES